MGLHSWGPDASFDTHIAISISDKWHMRQIWHFWHFWYKWRIWHPPLVMIRYGNIGVKRSARASGMLTNAIKQLLNRFNSLKCQNFDFQEFPLYFLKFILYNYVQKGSTSHRPPDLIFLFLESVEPEESDYAYWQELSHWCHISQNLLNWPELSITVGNNCK